MNCFEFRFLTGVFLAAIILVPTSFDVGTAHADEGNPYWIKKSVTESLSFIPRMEQLRKNREAISHEKDRAFGGYLPSVDLTLGYGVDGHDDTATRGRGEDVTDFEARTEASLRLRQMLFDGFDTKARVAVEKAKLESADMRVYDNAESITLDAAIAHLEVYRQRKLLALAEKNVTDHEEILVSLESRVRAGAGSKADVVQTRTRLSRALSTLAETRSELAAAKANYRRLVGIYPEEDLNGPGNIFIKQLPTSLEELLGRVKEENPKILALKADEREAGSRIDLAKANYYPQLTFEASTSYDDQIESSQTYEKNLTAMLYLRWNLYNGGSTSADVKAATARKYQAKSEREDRTLEILEEAESTWYRYLSVQDRHKAFTDAVRFSEETLDSYKKQFRVGQRSLLDVLDARNELFQSSGQLMTEKVNMDINALRLVTLFGGVTKAFGIDPQSYKAVQ